MRKDNPVFLQALAEGTGFSYWNRSTQPPSKRRVDRGRGINHDALYFKRSEIFSGLDPVQTATLDQLIARRFFTLPRYHGHPVNLDTGIIIYDFATLWSFDLTYRGVGMCSGAKSILFAAPAPAALQSRIEALRVSSKIGDALSKQRASAVAKTLAQGPLNPPKAKRL